jgi:copper(I)-binding protein
LIAISVALGLIASVHAQKSGSAAITIGHAWARVTANERITGAAYLTAGVKGPLKQRHAFPLTLNFEKAGKVDVMVQDEEAGAMGDSDMKHGADGINMQ